MNSDNVHLQTQSYPSLGPSLVKWKLNIGRVEMTGLLLGKGDFDSLMNYFPGRLTAACTWRSEQGPSAPQVLEGRAIL